MAGVSAAPNRARLGTMPTNAGSTSDSVRTAVGSLKRNHHRNDAPVGVSHYVSRRNSKLAHQTQAIVSLIDNAYRRCRMRRAHVAATVIVD